MWRAAAIAIINLVIIAPVGFANTEFGVAGSYMLSDNSLAQNPSGIGLFFKNRLGRVVSFSLEYQNWRSTGRYTAIYANGVPGGIVPRYATAVRERTRARSLGVDILCTFARQGTWALEIGGGFGRMDLRTEGVDEEGQALRRTASSYKNVYSVIVNLSGRLRQQWPAKLFFSFRHRFAAREQNYGGFPDELDRRIYFEEFRAGLAYEFEVQPRKRPSEFEDNMIPEKPRVLETEFEEKPKYYRNSIGVLAANAWSNGDGLENPNGIGLNFVQMVSRKVALQLQYGQYGHTESHIGFFGGPPMFPPEDTLWQTIRTRTRLHAAEVAFMPNLVTTEKIDLRLGLGLSLNAHTRETRGLTTGEKYTSDEGRFGFALMMGLITRDILRTGLDGTFMFRTKGMIDFPDADPWGYGSSDTITISEVQLGLSYPFAR